MPTASPLVAEIVTPAVVELPPKAKTVDVSVRTSLNNPADAAYVVHAPDPDSTHFWHVLDANHREIQRDTNRSKSKKPKAGEVHPICTKTVAAGHSLHDTHVIALNTAKLKPGQVYTVRARVWGHSTECTFTVVDAAPDAPKAKASKKKAKRSKEK